jgi:prohibitin 1
METKFNKQVAITLVTGGVLLLLAILAYSSMRTVEAGHIGVVTSFGKVEDAPLEEGLHFIGPWKSVHSLSVRTQEQKEIAQVPTKEGMAIDLEASLLFGLEKDKAREVFQKVGPDYVKVIVIPQFRSALRNSTVNYQARDLYTANRAEVEAKLESDVKAELVTRGIRVERVLLRKLEIPVSIKAAIEQKLAAEQDAERMKFVLERETQEAERRRVEAKGMADAQDIIQKNLSELYIRYLWVKALEGSTAKPSTVIYVPIGGDGMPQMTMPVKGSGK